MQPVLRTRREGQRDLPVAVWRFDEARLVASSAPHGGGIGPRRWIVNATVPASYGRRDPDRHLGKLGVSLGLPGRGAGMMTAVDVGCLERASDDGVDVVASVGLGKPLWAAADESSRAADARRVGTVNVVAFLPERLTEAALVNAVASVAEAKAQAMFDLGLPGTGTATDATCLVCPTEARLHRYGGPRSVWGARLARAVHAAVLAGGSRPAGEGTVR
jgi:adenosylcobinamide hydrolase